MSSQKIKKLYKQSLPFPFRKSIYSIRKKLCDMLMHQTFWLSDQNIRNMHSRLLEFKGVFKGNRCLIMGNGPSLNKMDLSLFENEIVWGSNRCYLLFNRINWRPRFFVAVDKQVVPDNAQEINNLPHELQDTSFFFPVIFRYNKTLKSANNVYWYNEIGFNENQLPYSMFSTNISKYVYTVRTVTVAMLQLAVYMGFNPIYLIGCDTNYFIPESVIHDNKDPSLLISTASDPNHFDPLYFGKDKKWNVPHTDRMIFHFEQSKKICDEMGINVYNATVGGSLEVFPRIDYLELFK